MQNVIKNIVALIVFGAIIFVFRERIENQFLQARDHYFPCKNPISYSIDNFDERFGLSKADFLLVIKQAEEIWEKPIGRDLFVEKTNGNLKINLIYDYRQNVTEKLKVLDVAVDDSKSSYDVVNARYIALHKEYLNNKNIFNARVTALKIRQDAYSKQVAYWNNNRGAPKEEFDALQLEKQNIQNELQAVNKLQERLNAEIENINALVATLNRLVKDLNLDVARFNEVGASRGEEFEEALYKSSAEGQSIDIYQYDSKSKLVRVMAHEFGHALGLDHLENPKAIMYKLNEGTNESLTEDDLSALKAHCGIY